MNIENQLNILRNFQSRYGTDLLTLVFTQLADSKLKTRLGDAGFRSILEKYQSSVRTVLKDFSAAEVNSEGDPFFLVFANPAEAVLFSTKLHETNRVASSETGELIKARVGIHTAEILVKGQPLEGTIMHVNLCARLMGICGQGRTIMTRIAYDKARHGLTATEAKNKMTWTTLESVLRKGYAEPLEIFEVCSLPVGDTAAH